MLEICWKRFTFELSILNILKMIMTINFYLDSKLLDNNEKSIICFIRGIEKGKTTYINTKIKINPELWNNQKQNVRRNHPNSMQFNSYLDKMKNEIQLIYIDYIGVNKNMDLKLFKLHLFELLFNAPEPAKELSFYDVFEIYMNIKKNELAKSSYEKYYRTKKHLQEYEKYSKTKVNFANMDLLFFDKFFDYCLKRAGHTNNTIYKLIVNLKTFLNWAFERGYHNNLVFKKVRTKEEKIEIVYLTERELIKLLEFDLSGNTKLSNLRDVFCLSCFTGVRFSDITNLKFEDIKNDTWYLRTKKTKDMLEIPLSEYALDILNKYILDGIKLPVISNQKSNEYLKELCKLVEIDEPTSIVKYKGSARIEVVKPKFELVSTHTARRTFVTLSLEKGMRPETVMEITGHKDYKTMKKYIKITSKVKHNEMNSVWKKV